MRRRAATWAPPGWGGRRSSARPAPGGPCRGQRAVLEQPRALRRRAAVDVRREPQAHRARGRRTRAAPLTITSSDRPSKREVEPAREKRERVAASLREDPLPHVLVGWSFAPTPPRSCCWAERKARARALLDDRESLSKVAGRRSTFAHVPRS